MNCLFCKSELEQQGGGRIAIHFVCPNGCGAWWPEEDRTDEEALKIWNSEQAYKQSITAKKGGGGKAGRKRRKKPKADMSGKYWLPDKKPDGKQNEEEELNSDERKK